METFNNINVVEITREEFDRLKTLLDYEELPDEHRDKGFANGFEFKFSNGSLITFDVYTGGHNAYDHTMLRSAKGYELLEFDCTFSIDETMEFTSYAYGTYVCKFTIV